MYTIRKIFKFESAHILDSAYSKECTTIHGHNYKVEVFLSTETLNEDGMVIDFKELKEIIYPIFKNWDHKLIHSPLFALNATNSIQVDFNPTAENMALYLHDEIVRKLAVKLAKQGGFKAKVRIHETDTGWAEYES